LIKEPLLPQREARREDQEFFAARRRLHRKVLTTDTEAQRRPGIFCLQEKVGGSEQSKSENFRKFVKTFQGCVWEWSIGVFGRKKLVGFTRIYSDLVGCGEIGILCRIGMPPDPRF
jgi:hypothetical protein